MKEVSSIEWRKYHQMPRSSQRCLSCHATDQETNWWSAISSDVETSWIKCKFNIMLS